MNRVIKNKIIVWCAWLLPMLALGQETAISLKVAEHADCTVVVGRHDGGRLYVADSLWLDADGATTWVVDSLIPEGFYELVLPDDERVTLLVGNDRRMTIVYTSADSSVVRGAEESIAFAEYQHYIRQVSEKKRELDGHFKAYRSMPDSVARYRKLATQIDAEVKAFFAQECRRYPASFYATVMRALAPPSYPDFSMYADSVRRAKSYAHRLGHYFDDFAIDDARLLRTPLYKERLDYYYKKLLPMLPDTVVSHSLALLERSKASDETFRYVLNYMMQYAEGSKVMGMDAFTLSLLQEGYLSPQANWVKGDLLQRVREQVAFLEHNQIGSKAKGFAFPLWNNPEQIVSVYDGVQDYTVVMFWEPDCGHCQKEVPQLYEHTFEKYSTEGVRFLAVCAMTDTAMQRAFIRKHELYDWVNVCDDGSSPRYKVDYNLQTVPAIYVLDREKRIVAKGIGEEGLEQFLQNEMKMN